MRKKDILCLIYNYRDNNSPKSAKRVQLLLMQTHKSGHNSEFGAPDKEEKLIHILAMDVGRGYISKVE